MNDRARPTVWGRESGGWENRKKDLGRKIGKKIRGKHRQRKRKKVRIKVRK